MRESHVFRVALTLAAGSVGALFFQVLGLPLPWLLGALTATMAASLETITYLTREQLVEIVIDFLRHLRQSTGSLRGGPDEARKFLEGVLDAPRFDYGVLRDVLLGKPDYFKTED